MIAPANSCPPDQTFARLIDGMLAADQVRQLQGHCDGCSRCSLTLADLARTLAPDGDDWLGDRYRLLEPLGAGEMAVVYTAFDRKLQRRVAIKRLRETDEGASSERRRGRFLREAQLLASLSHPNVLTVHDVGGSDHELYVVTELVDGWSMSRWITEVEPRPPWRQIVDHYVDVGRGLAAAHQLGVIHRDVKPDNILVARSGRVLIGDFGLAGLIGPRPATPATANAPASLTQTGTVLGTPAYMAPELYDGEPGDARSDQFSFCVSLYESLHGRRPFTGQSTGEIAAAVRAGRLPIGRDGVPGTVDRVLATGLSADASRRHATMEALLTALVRAADQRALRPSVATAAVATILAVALSAAYRDGRELPAASVITVDRGSHPPARALVPPPAPAAAPEPPATPPALPAPNPTRATKRAPTRRTVAWVSRERAAVGADQQTDPLLLLYLADRGRTDRDGTACLQVLNTIAPDAWPTALADQALRQRASCEMLRGNCHRGHRLLAALDGPDSARATLLSYCPAGALDTIEDRLLAVTAQADDARYGGNPPDRRRALRDILARQAVAPEIQGCFGQHPARACPRRLAILTRAYQVLADSFLMAGDCREGAVLDVMQSELGFQAQGPQANDPALRCRAQRIAEVYRTCATAGDEAERQCVARAR